jgi:hypothetical protein
MGGNSQVAEIADKADSQRLRTRGLRVRCSG